VTLFNVEPSTSFGFVNLLAEIIYDIVGVDDTDAIMVSKNTFGWSGRDTETAMLSITPLT
jgi:hypothetical protein